MIKGVIALATLLSVLGLNGSSALAKGITRMQMICTNLASGSSWWISIDFSHSTVDSNLAEIGHDGITWHDAKDNGNYSLDRSSGTLSAVFASSTGGYILQHHCKQAHEK